MAGQLQGKEGCSKRLMTSEVVLDCYRQMAGKGVQVWIDGGWGVDALLGAQTRPHADLDIVIQQKDLPELREFLERRGYKDVPRDDTCPWNFVLGDGFGHEIDVHAIVFDANGNGLYGPVEKGIMYPAPSLTGFGVIGGQSVQCISAEWSVKFHTGYTLHDSDYHDVTSICDRFGIEYPEEYAKLKNSGEFRSLPKKRLHWRDLILL